MANASAKRIAAANQITAQNLRRGLFLVNLVYMAWTTYRWNWTLSLAVAYLCTCGLTVFFFRILVSSGQPAYNEDGSILSSGEDLNAEGLTAYMFDIIYITWFVHLTTAFISNKFWYCYLAIPVYALYKVVPFVKSFLGSRNNLNDSSSHEKTGKSKRQQKMEERAKQGKVNVKYR